MECKYVISHSRYYDCPTCDGNGSDDIETVYVSRELDYIFDIIEFLKQDWGIKLSLILYRLEKQGKLVKVCDINNHTAGHKLVSIKFELDGFTYTIKEDGSIESNNPNFNILYGK